MQGNLEKEPNQPNLDQVIDNIQFEPIEHVVPITMSKWLVVVATEASQPVQLLVEPIQIKNPQFFITQPILVSSHSIDNLRQISMFLN
jgi:hypothetical protein